MKVTSQIPSSTSLMPSLCPAMTVEDVDFLSVDADTAAGGDEDVAVVEGIFEVGQTPIGAA